MDTTDLTKEFAAALREMLRRRNARADIAKKVGSTPGHISNVANERRHGSEKLRRKIAEACGYSYEDFIALGKMILEGRQPPAFPQIANVETGPDFQGRVPLISWVQAGNWSPVADPFQPGVADEWVETMRRVGPHAFALRVVGDSMVPEFWEGETIVVDPDREPTSGSYVIAKIDGGGDGNGEATFKQFIKDGDMVFLRPINDRYPIIDMTNKKFRIVGVVVEKRKTYR